MGTETSEKIIEAIRLNTGGCSSGRIEMKNLDIESSTSKPQVKERTVSKQRKGVTSLPKKVSRVWLSFEEKKRKRKKVEE